MLEKTRAVIILDASKIDLFETCACRYNIRHNLNKTLPLIQKAEALDKGSLAHNGFEVYFNELAKGTIYKDRMELTLMKIRELSSNPDQSNLDPDDVEALMKAIEESCDYWRSEDENCLEILAVEQPFAYELFSDEEVQILISGKIDLLVNYKPIGRGQEYKNLVIDHKTYSRDSMLLRKSNQFINYCAAASSNYLVVNRVGLQKSLKAEEKHKRLPLSYDPFYIQAWKDNLTKKLLQDYLTCVATGYWPESPTSCNKFNRLCEYYRICDSPANDDKDRILLNEYVDGDVWDVTKDMGKE